MSRKLKELEDRPECSVCGKPMHLHDTTKSGKQRWRHCGTSTTRKAGQEVPGEIVRGFDLEKAEKFLKDVKAKIRSKIYKGLVVTCAVNNTPVFEEQLETLRTYCKKRHAALVVIPVSYKNVSAYQNAREYEKWYDNRLTPYLLPPSVLAYGKIDIRADVRIRATAVNPLGGKDPIGGLRWSVYGATSMHLRSVASPNGVEPKRMYTTGSITGRNYSRSDAGAKADFHHVQGALAIFRKGSKIFARQLNFDSDGTVYDLDTRYQGKKVKHKVRALGLILGDSHVRNINKSAKKCIFTRPDSAVNILRPEQIVHHDVLDGWADSHHDLKDDVLRYRKFQLGENDYRKELDEVVDYLNETTPKWAKNVIVASNHHEHLTKWLSRADPRQDPTNAMLILELKQLQYENVVKGDKYDPYDSDAFRLYLEDKLTCNTEFLRRNSTYEIGGVGVQYHGDKGVNGARGSIVPMSKTTRKLFIAHNHSAGIYHSVYQVGKISNDAEYEQGLSSHTTSIGVIYPNGKRAIIDILGGEWRE